MKKENCKKLLSLTLILMLSTAMVACGNSKEDKQQETPTETTQENTNTGETNVGEGDSETTETKAPVDILTAVWETYKEEEKFPCTGGDFNNTVDNAPGTFDITDKASLESVLLVPQDIMENIDTAASLMHMMNANTFTCGAFHLNDANALDDFIAKLEEKIVNNPWMCGFPDTLIIVKIDDTNIVSAFGHADIIENFKGKLLDVHNGAEVVTEKNLAE